VVNAGKPDMRSIELEDAEVLSFLEDIEKVAKNV
jgi:hypothetical protein